MNPNEDSTFLEPHDVPTAWAYLVLNDYRGPPKHDGGRHNIRADEATKVVGFDPKTGNGTWRGIAPEYRWDHMARKNCCDVLAQQVPLPNYCGQCATGIGAETWQLGEGSSIDPALAAEIDAMFNTPVEELAL